MNHSLSHVCRGKAPHCKHQSYFGRTHSAAIKTLTQGTIAAQDQIIYCEKKEPTKLFWPKVFVLKFWFILDILWLTGGLFLTCLKCTITNGK